MAETVAGVGVRQVGFIGDPLLAAGNAIGFHLDPGQTEQRADIEVPHRPDAPGPVEPGPPGQPEQQGFRLICNSMGRGNAVYPFPVKPPETGIPEAAGPRFPARGIGQTLLPRPEHPQGHPQTGTFRPDKGLVGVCRFAPQPVIHMAGGDGDFQGPGQSQQNPQQGHAVRSP